MKTLNYLICGLVLMNFLWNSNGQIEQDGSLDHDDHCNYQQATEAAHWFFYFDADREAPSNQTTMSEYCSKAVEYFKILSDHEKCLIGFHKQLVQLFNHGVKRHIKMVCRNKNGKIRKQFMEASGCFENMKSKGRGCLSKLIGDLYIVKHLPKEHKLNNTCCAFFRMERCFSETPEKCSAKDIEMLEDLIIGLSGSLIRFVCKELNSYDGEKRCLKPLLPEGKKKQIQKNLFYDQHFNRSMLVPLIDILLDLPKLY